MKTLTEGHKYLLANFEDNNQGQTIQFIEKGKRADDSLFTINDGTTNEELLKCLITRMYYLNSKFPCKENSCAITHFEEGLMWLEKRTNDRKLRNVEGKNLI